MADKETKDPPDDEYKVDRGFSEYLPPEITDNLPFPMGKQSRILSDALAEYYGLFSASGEQSTEERRATPEEGSRSSEEDRPREKCIPYHKGLVSETTVPCFPGLSLLNAKTDETDADASISSLLPPTYPWLNDPFLGYSALSSRAKDYLAGIDYTGVDARRALTSAIRPPQTKLEGYLAYNHPSNTTDLWAARVDEAFNAFPCPAHPIEDAEKAKEIVGDFYTCICVVFSPGSRDLEYRWERCRDEVLRHHYKPAYTEHVLRNIRTGVEGGIYDVFRVIAQSVLQEATKKLLTGRGQFFWTFKADDYDQEQMPREYFRKHFDVLPPHIREEGPSKLYQWFPDILDAHHQIIKQLQFNLRQLLVY